MFAGDFAERLRVSRKLVPESIKVNTFATRDKSFHVGTAKAEMPEKRIPEYLFQRSKTRQAAVHP
jgi:hypothetical protein